MTCWITVLIDDVTSQKQVPLRQSPCPEQLEEHMPQIMSAYRSWRKLAIENNVKASEEDEDNYSEEKRN